MISAVISKTCSCLVCFRDTCTCTCNIHVSPCCICVGNVFAKNCKISVKFIQWTPCTCITSQTQLIFRIFTCHRKRAVFCECCRTMNVFQVNTKLVTAAHSQAVNLVQSEPKLAVQIAKASFVIIPNSVEIYRAIPSHLKYCPSSTGYCVITEDFKFTQTIRIDFVHSTDLVTRLVNFGTVLVNWKLKHSTINSVYFVFPFLNLYLCSKMKIFSLACI